MATLPKRSDEIYKEIESFEDYELTQCVAYEMAIRHDEVKNLFDLIDIDLELLTEDLKLYKNNIKINEIYDKSLEEYDRLYQKAEGDMGIRDELNIPDLYDMFLFHCKVVDIKGYVETLISKFWIRSFYIDDIVEEIKHRNIKNKFYLLNKQTKFLKELGVMTHFQSIVSSEDGRAVITDDIVFYLSMDIDEIHPLGGSIGIDKLKSKQIDINKTMIFNNLKRLITPKIFDKTIDVKLNLNFPKNELIAYIKKLKDVYDEDRNIIRTSMQVLGDDLQSADNLICPDKGKCFDSRTILSKQQRLADMFFLYDYLKHNEVLASDTISAKYKRVIQNEVFNYYKDENNTETKILDIKTMKKYKNIAIDYIDNMRYKELITGIKIDDLKV